MTSSDNPTHQTITGEAAGVPFVAIPPAAESSTDSPIVIAWHLMDPPRSEAAFAAALPLAGLNAWRIYLGLPMLGARLPEGGFDEIIRLAMEDAVLNLYGPIAKGAVAEAGAVLAELRARLALGNGPIGFLGGSMGSASALLALLEGDLPVSTAVLVSPMVQLRPAVDSFSQFFGAEYNWTEASDQIASQMDFPARANEIAGKGEPPILLIVGDEDEDGFKQPAFALKDALTAAYTDASRVGLQVIPGMGHALAEEPGMEPAPQTAHAAQVDRLAVDWLKRHLPGS